MILQANEACVRPRSSVRIMRARRFRWHGLSLREVRHLHAIEVHDAVRPINRYIHRVPFANRLDRTRQCLCKCLEHARARVVVGPVAYFNLVSSVDWHPRFSRFFRYADKDPGV